MTLGVLLAGGRGRRLGAGMPKALVTVAGRTLLDRALDTLNSICEETVVCTRPNLELPVSADRLLRDAPGGLGPIAGAVAGLTSRPFDRAVLFGVDMPLIGRDLLEALLAELERSGRIAVIPAPGGILQPLASVVRPEAVAPLSARYDAGERSITSAMLSLDPLILDDAAVARLPGGVGCFLNVNHSGDVAEAQRRLSTGARS